MGRIGSWIAGVCIICGLCFAASPRACAQPIDQAEGQGRVVAQPIASNDLIDRARELDGTDVYFEGEVVGNVMRRGGHAWVNVFDGQNAIGIWMKAADAGMIRHEGAYQMTGDRIAVSGVFNRACSEHGGDLDIHAVSVRVVEPGRIIVHPLPRRKIQLAATLAAAVGALWIFMRLRRR